MVEWIKSVWTTEVQLLPVSLSLFLFELPALVRRLKKLYYVPLYFSAFPLSEINADLSVYLGQDFIGSGKKLTLKKREQLRKRIMFVSVVSMAIGALLTPVLTGFVSALYMSPRTFWQFIIILIMLKIYQLTASILRFHRHVIATRRSRFLLVLVYLTYGGVIFELTRQAYFWTLPYIAENRWVDLVSEISTLLFGKLIAAGLLLALLTTILISWITDRALGEENERHR